MRRRPVNGTPLATENLLEDTDGLLRLSSKEDGRRNPSVTSRCGSLLLLFLLTCALLMTASHSEGSAPRVAVCFGATELAHRGMSLYLDENTDEHDAL